MRKTRLNLWQFFLLFAFLVLGLYWGDRQGVWDQVRGKLEGGVIWGRIKTYETHETYVGEEELKAKILSLENEARFLKEENRELRRQLQAPLPAAMKFIPGRVIGVKCQVSSIRYQVSGIKCQEEELLLAVGKREGVEERMAVVIENILIGRVSQVTPRMSKVRLLTDLESRVTVKAEGGARGIVQGSRFKVQGSKTVLLDRVLQGEELRVGEKVLTSGEDGIPADLLVGKVVEVLVEEREPFKKAVVELFVDPGEVGRVFVVRE